MPNNDTKNDDKNIPVDTPNRPAKPRVNSRPAITGTRVISYNLSEEERPGGIKVRYKIRVVTGKRAEEIDARQAQAILEVLRWARQHPTTPSG
jgi:hypothetical protein